MPKPLRLDKDRKLAIPELAVERNITEFLLAEGWLVFPTKAEARMPSGAPAYRSGTLDLLALRSWPTFETLFVECKRRMARTNKKHLAEQTATARWLRDQGFTVFQAPENDVDPITSFRAFYEETFA